MHNNRQFSPTHSKARTWRIVGGVFLIIIVISVPITRSVFFRGIRGIGMGVSYGVSGVSHWFGSIGTALRSKSSFEKENTELKSQVSVLTTRVLTTDTLIRENTELKTILGRTEKNSFTLLSVLEKPTHSMYDTLIVDGGASVGCHVGDVVYVNGESPIGTIAEVYPYSALVRLYSMSGEKTHARLSPSNIDVELVGQGGGNFIATVPHDLAISDSMTVVTKEINPRVIAVFKKVTSDPRDPFQTLLLASLVNMNELNFVQVKK